MDRHLKNKTYFPSLENLQVDMNCFAYVSVVSARWSFLALRVEEFQQILYSMVYKRAY